MHVHICEVGPRDGLQNAHHLMSTEAKKRWISALAAAGEGRRPAVGVSVELDNSLNGESHLMCNRDALVGACTNLVNNSLEAGATRVSVHTVAEDGELVIRVIDNGPGFAPGDADRLMEAFYTTKSHGTGLGLAVVQAVIKAHQGRFSIESPEQGGAIATLRLPQLRNKH